MATVALNPGYDTHVPFRDVQANFHGNMLVYVHWEDHLSYCAALAFPLPPAMPFQALVDDIIKGHYNAHPDFAKVDWAKVEWMIDGKKVKPDMAKSLADNGMHHKSLVRFWTPGLKGYKGSAS